MIFDNAYMNKLLYFTFIKQLDPLMGNLADTLSHLMFKKGIKSAELARKTGVGQPVIYRLMTGITDNPQINTLKPIADYFGVSLDQLVGIIPLTKQNLFNNTSLHDLQNKLITIKTISSVLVDLLPSLIDGYKKSVAGNLMKKEIPEDILPLLLLNGVNLMKAINQIQELLLSKTIIQDEL